jgi:hypothetical protein
MPDAPAIGMQLVQRGVETVAGTLVPATHRVPADMGSIEISTTIDRIRRRYAGSRATSHSSSSGLVHPTISYDEAGTYDYFAVLLQFFLATPVITGAGPDKVWTYTGAETDTLKRASLEVGGKDTWPAEERYAGCVGRVLDITWNKTDDWRFAQEYIAMRNTQGAKAAGLTLPSTLVPILGRLTRVYVDPTTIGTTSYGRGISGSIHLENRVSERFGSDGNDYSNRIAVMERTVTAGLVVEYDAVTLRDAWRSGTIQKLRVEAPGPSLGASNYNARLDIVGTWETSEIGEDDGIITLEHELTAQYDSGLASDIVGVVTCSLAATP